MLGDGSMATNFKQAAWRTKIDAETLFGDGRLGTADQLFGVAAECALKAVLVALGVFPPSGPPKKSSFRCHIDKLWDEYAIHMSGLAQAPLPANPFTAWKMDHRYEEDSTFTPSRLQTHRDGAQTALGQLEDALVKGRIP